MLTSRADGLRNILGLSRRQHEDHVSRRLFQSLQKRIERRVRDLMGFVEDVYLEPVASGAIPCSLAQFANFVNTAVSSGIDLNYIDGIAGANLDT